MRKYLFMILCMVMAVAIITACSSGNDDDQEVNDKGKDTNSDEEVTISIYYPTNDQPEQQALEDDKIRRFEDAYPHVTVERHDWHYDPGEIGIRMAGDDAPTLFNTYATEGRFLVERGWAADITDLWEAYEFKDQVNPILQEQFAIDGKVYGIPQQGYVTGTVVNKKMLEEKGVDLPPFDWTWEDFFETAKAATDVDKGISGIALMGQGNEAGWIWTSFLNAAGGIVQEIEGDKVKAKFNSEAGYKALDFYHRLRWEANAVPQDWALDWGGAVGSFAQGRSAMVIAGADGPLDQALNQGGFDTEDILVYPIPTSEKGGSHTAVLGGDYLIVNPNASELEQEAAFNYAVFDYFTDEGLESIEVNIQERAEDSAYYIPQVLTYYYEDSEYGKKVQEVYAKYDNVYQYPVETLRLYDGLPEAQFQTQEYYGIMTEQIQKIFSDEDFDLQELLDEAEGIVQEDYFDTIEIE